MSILRDEIITRLEQQIESLQKQLNDSKMFHCPHYLTDGSGNISCDLFYPEQLQSVAQVKSENEQLQKENRELLNVTYEDDKRIVKLQAENEFLRKAIGNTCVIGDVMDMHHLCSTEKKQIKGMTNGILELDS